MNQRLVALLLTGISLSGTATIAQSNVAVFINGQVQQLQVPSSTTIQNSFGIKPIINLEATARSFIQSNAAALGIHPHSEFKLEQNVQGEDFSTQRFQNFFRGLEVKGGETLIQIANNEVIAASASASNLENMDLNPRLSASDAENIAFTEYQGEAWKADSAQLKILMLATDTNAEAKLVYEVKVRDRDRLGSDIYYIDAHGGNLVQSTSNVHTIKSRKVFVGRADETDFENLEKVFGNTNSAAAIASFFPLAKSDSVCQSRMPVSKPWWMSNNLSIRTAAASTAGCTPVSNPAVVDSAEKVWTNSGLVYDYYKQAFNRDSFDNRGSDLQAIVNLGEKYANAAWINDIQLMIYGSGDPTTGTTSFANPLDVTAHELTHGVTGSTSKLVYSAQSGALNESYSDVMAKVVVYRRGGKFDWFIGKELFSDGRFIRNMENPEVGHMKDYKYANQICTRLNDFCGVHINSGIPNKVAVYLAKTIGMERVAKIYYTTLTQLLKSNSNFKDAKTQTLFACSRLYRDPSTCKIVKEAFDKMGIL